MNIQIFGKSKCFDTKKAERWFKERRIRFQSIDLGKYGISPGELKSVLNAVGLEALVDPKHPDAALLAYLAGNIDLFCGTIRRELPQLRVQAPQGTYLVWVDCSGLGLEPDALQRFLVEECRLALSDGRDFGPDGAGRLKAHLR